MGLRHEGAGVSLSNAAYAVTLACSTGVLNRMLAQFSLSVSLFGKQNTVASTCLFGYETAARCFINTERKGNIEFGGIMQMSPSTWGGKVVQMES